MLARHLYLEYQLCLYCKYSTGKSIIFVLGKCVCPLTHCRCCGLYYFVCIGVVDMKPEKYKGFLIVEAPGQMFKATKIVESAHFKSPP